MSELTKKVIAAGIVPEQAVKLMQRWGGIDPELSSEVKAVTEQQLLEFVGEIEQLLEDASEVPELRETDLDLSEQTYVQSAQPLIVSDITGTSWIWGYRDRLGRFVFRVSGNLRPAVGSHVQYGSRCYAIIDVELRYEHEQPKWFVCSTQEVKD